MLGGRLLHGGDYNPDQWLDYPEILEEDIEMMKEAGVNCVSLGMFSWAALEPEEGVYQFEWLEELVDRLGREGIQVILSTPSAAMPHWLTTRYPQTRQVRADGTKNLPGKRHNFCYTSPVMREKTQAVDRKLSERFGKKENVILWHISNELGGNFGDSTCHCELCQQAFREWLREKYKTLDALNAAWWNGFWSHTYTDWSQIHSPAPQGETTSTALFVEWKRFSTEQMSRFCEMEIEAVRAFSDRPATTNFMDFFKGLNYNRLKRGLDIISWDNYPNWHKRRDEVPVAVRTAADHSLMRSLKKQPFLMMESTPSSISWRQVNPLKRPGMHMLSSLQAVAHGADSVQYFQWRKSRGGYEKFHGAVMDHKNGSQTRTFSEVAQLGQRLKALSPLVDGTVNRPSAAIIFDWENWWAVEDTQGPRLDFNYVKTVLEHYRAFWENGIEADFVGMDEPLDGYALVSAPLNYMYKDGYAERVRTFVEGGGLFVTTCFSGEVNETDLCFAAHHPLEEVLGIVPEEIDAPSEEFSNSFFYGGREYPAVRLCAVVHPKEGTKVLAEYQRDFYAGAPAVTEHCYGEGAAFYLAAQSDLDFMRAFYGELFKRAGLENPLGEKLPYGVTVTERKPVKEGKKGLIFVMNFSHDPARVELSRRFTDAESGEEYVESLCLKGLECRILEKAED